MTYGVVGPIGCDTSDKEIADSLTTQGYNNVEVKRITKSRGGETTKTIYVRIGLSIPMLREFVYLEYQRFKMKSYISKPWQCYRCQKFGHNADNCRSNIRCVACTGPHAVLDCTVRKKSHVKCINCGGNHTASYGGCQFIKNARVVEQVRSEKKLSYRDAVTLVKSSANSSRQPQSNYTNAVFSPPSSVSIGAKTAVGRKHNNNAHTGEDAPIFSRKGTDMSTQTESSLLSGPLDVSTFLAKLTAAFIQVIIIKHDAETVDQVVAVTNIVNSIMKVSVNACEVQSLLPGTKAQMLNPSVSAAPTEVMIIPETPPSITSVPETPVSNNNRQTEAKKRDLNNIDEGKNYGKNIKKNDKIN